MEVGVSDFYVKLSKYLKDKKIVGVTFGETWYGEKMVVELDDKNVVEIRSSKPKMNYNSKSELEYDFKNDINQTEKETNALFKG